ncbi:mechanosensitive ion channel family protein [Salinigranum halophilum]|jgi:small-conductance mechanosensitive channel|uniref:mechanosensitive ion channel family protein n=1 Tax=Salinigranum halophilum TaxID=2565931 RepID=UPI0010A81294|nr:mechanosensitive ion channel family protein [Salinigranum halophilum]
MLQTQPTGLDALVPGIPEKVVVTVVAVLVVSGVWRVADYLHDRSDESTLLPSTWRHLLVSGMGVLVTVGGGLFVVAVWGLTGPLVEEVQSYGLGPQSVVNVVLALVIIVTAYGMTDLVGRITRELSDSRRAITEHQREIVYRLSQVSLYTVAGSLILGIWGVDLGGVLVGAGFLGIVVGLAARQTLGALLAGFVLMFSRPFEIGDWVEIGEHEGIVTDITIVTTRMQTFDGEYVMVPNDVVSSESVVNRSRKGRLRIEVDVGIDYDADPRAAAEVARDAVGGLDNVLRVPTPQVVVKEFADSAVLLGVRVWIDNPSARRMWRTRTAVVSAVKRAFDEEGIKIPFPQRELTGREESGGFHLADGSVLAGGEEVAAEADGGQSESREAEGS